ncbi:tyrosine-protein phosphatase non-receptor type 13-like isoform X1 [Daphnia pulicaria]|uniref:tyrosine-protein phosphatase non-receptor type 13-like isoform X1 n=1 Tax=Daphnia pulicaria TaxID=35523 RepID=UPI001EEBB66E|nr:tyrosine-protein phosphatase non-receptor type 13-like isoform X1 [Daphnia pulicaria]XP_046642995.1 tyrosine-protein phosphatase non-receptor type 13-like isoform X1 [Daphnia pulicaria]
MLVSAEEVLDVRGSLLHVTETEAILLQLLRQLSLHQHNKADCRPASETELRLKHILLEASGQVQLHRDVAQTRWSVSQLARVLAGASGGFAIGARTLLQNFADPSVRSVPVDRAIQILKLRIQPAIAARYVAALYGEVLARESAKLTAKGRVGHSRGEDCSSTEDSAISSDHLSRHPSTDSLNRFTSMANQSDTTGHSTPPEHYGVFRRRRPIRLARARSSVGDGGPTGALKNLAWAANAAIQRAPSRLYRLHDQPSSTPSLSSSAAAFHPRKSQSFRDLKVSIEREDEPAICPVTCCGPEFIVKSSLPPYVVILPHQPKKKKSVNILHLDGRRLHVECDPGKTRINQLMQMVMDHFGIAASDAIFFGLSCIKGGHFVFPRLDEKVSCLAPDNYKQLPYPSFNVYFRFRFYVHSVFTLHSLESEHLLYLQLRKDLLEQRWVMDPMEEMGLAALALTIEFGTYNPKIHGVGGSYFHVDHYLSAGTQQSVKGGELAAQALQRLHGRIPTLVERRVVECNFVKRIMQTQSYGYHHVHVIEDDGLRTTPLNLLVGLEGLKLVPHATTTSFGTSLKHVSLYWEDIKSLTHSKHHIVLTSGIGNSIRKRRLCVGTSRIRNTFDLLISHQKMALELKKRKLLIRSESATLPKLRHNRPASFIEPVKTPVEPVKSLSSATLPRPSNAVRIYVPFGGVQKRPDTNDITTRVIDVKSNIPMPELVPVTSAESSQYSTLSSLSESTVPTSPRKSTLVRMGTKVSSDALIREKMRLQEVSFSERVVSGDPSGAYVVDTSVKSEDESLVFDAQESMSQSLTERFNRLPRLPSPTRQHGVTVRFSKDPDGSLGILIARGVRGGIYLMGLTPNGAAHRQTSLKPGDRILSVNGLDCDELDYDQVIDQIRRIPRDVELFVLHRPDAAK